MANQTELLNVSDEMKLDDERQSFEGLECGEGLCSSSSDTTEELYSSSAPDTCGDGSLDVKSTEVRTANSPPIRGFREFGVNMTGLLQALFFVSMRTGLL